MPADPYTPWWEKALRLLLLCALFFGSIAILYALFGRMNDTGRAQLSIEVCKSLLQLIVVILLGGLVTWIIKYLENTKKADKALNEFRLEFINKLSSVDESVMKSRRVLRSVGLIRKAGVITPAQIGVYDEQIACLLDAEIGVGRLIRDLQNFRDAFSSNVVLEQKLKGMERFLRALLDEYEHLRPTFPQLLFTQLAILQGFTDVPVGANYSDWLKGYEGAIFIVRGDLLPLKSSV